MLNQLVTRLGKLANFRNKILDHYWIIFMADHGQRLNVGAKVYEGSLGMFWGIFYIKKLKSWQNKKIQTFVGSIEGMNFQKKNQE